MVLGGASSEGERALVDYRLISIGCEEALKKERAGAVGQELGEEGG